MEESLQARAALKLRAAGLTEEEARRRVGRLAPPEVFHIAEEVPSVRHGGSAVGAILVVLVITTVACFVALYAVTDRSNTVYH